MNEIEKLVKRLRDAGHKITVENNWVAVTWQPKTKWGYFYIWNDGPYRAFWIGHVAIEWWWR